MIVKTILLDLASKAISCNYFGALARSISGEQKRGNSEGVNLESGYDPNVEVAMRLACSLVA